ncbi:MULTISPECIES: hypothetical protein [Flavobacterium]|jgi:hypothetical protein|uniref:Uncharacterized protein n=1 Tax=Flavobacterium lindanitolerans TaxID=428988 RepID=A0A497U2G9_9FLAO|nr:MULTISPECIES: hypothetical protein [Flavobacterium]KQS47669.1 hypothetical protein ASG38_09520 [Flavobacterium sp. Leaf359]MBC8645035.1 hypothetical protein [Flavobacterium lindanitolerans]MDQ7961971.1 hypothetical protein [Flavobacterium lindanitolerans]OJX54192.1 MAG: hypothetical protein BGO88_11090 [Flavobacterium sp. 38-13]PKW30052.1 hypothetical protein B0G92_1701 [Flavobacterium lindanitolerans]
MKKCFVLFIVTIFTCCSPKGIKKDITIIEMQISPSFWFQKKIVFNVKEKYLLYKNLSAFVDEERWVLRNEASENTLISLTDSEVDSLVMLYDKIIISEEEVLTPPDGETILIQAIENNKLVSIHNGEGIYELRKALIGIVKEKSNDPKIKKEMLRL